MNVYLSILILIAYFLLLLIISHFTGKRTDASDFYRGGNKSPWWAVAFGMIGTTLSGVTFISVPGWVSSPAKMTYMAVIFGNFVGYVIIAQLLLPLYYKLNLTSIYSFIERRFGFCAYKTSAVLFLLSKTIGAAFRLFIVTLVLQITIFDPLHIPFVFNALFSVFIIWAYTVRGGIKTIVWTDLIQTFFLIFAVVFTIGAICGMLGYSLPEAVKAVAACPQSQVFDFSDFWSNPNHFWKQFVAGIFIAVAMNGLDQDMMQKNLSLRNIREAKKNFLSFSLAFIPVNFIFLCLGVLFFIFMQTKGIPVPSKTDGIYPLIATSYLPTAAGICFMLGVIAAAFSSANSAMIAMTTSFTVDICPMEGKNDRQKSAFRFRTHTGMALLLALVIVLFNALNDESVVSAIFKFAGYTYGPLLGLFLVGMGCKWRTNDRAVPYIAAFSVVATILIDRFSTSLLGGYRFGFEILLVNGLITTIGLLLFRKRRESEF